MAQWVKLLSAKPDSMSSIPGTVDGRKELTPHRCPGIPTHVPCTCTPIPNYHTHTIIVTKKKKNVDVNKLL